MVCVFSSRTRSPLEHIWPRPVVKGKKNLGICPDARIDTASALRDSALMVYALPVLIIFSAFSAMLQARFSESRSGLFPIVPFPLATVGQALQKRLAGRLRANLEKRSAMQAA